MRNRDKPFRIICTNRGRKITLGFLSLERAEQHAEKMNKSASELNLVGRYQAIQVEPSNAVQMADDRRCLLVLGCLRSAPNGATKNRIGRAMGIDSKCMTRAIETLLLESGSIESCEVIGGNNIKYKGFRVISQ
ncbi:hypothetical protein LCGC14_1888950 [marine sediment metagenome]|uniref:Uncharacterized protein n=1 Tax=marine sediment metagenome TaxID=412755 RepID=A0A0F9G008_9ZZZZ